MDFVSANCQSECTDLEFRPYTDSCDVSDGDLQALGFAICGTEVACPTIEADFTTLQTNNQFVIIKGVSGSKADPTPIEVDTSAYSCFPDKFVKEYQESLNFTAPNNPANHLLWKQFRENSTIASQFFYVNKSLVVYEAPSSPSVFVSYGVENGIDVVTGSVEWTTNTLETPYKGLTNIWAC